MKKNRLVGLFKGPLFIAILYLIFSALYILFSDILLMAIIGEDTSLERITELQTLKGIGFITVTSLIIYVLIRRDNIQKNKIIEEVEQKKLEHEKLSAEYLKLNEELKKRNEFIETALDNLPLGVAINLIDEGSATYVNKKFSEIYGWPAKDLENIERFFKLVYPDEEYRSILMKQVLEDIQSGDPERMVWNGVKVTTQEGERRIVNAKNIPVFDQNLMISTAIDVTDSVFKEQEIQQYQKSLQNLTTEITLAEERQRRIIASNIHDNLSQSLVISRMKLKGINKNNIPYDVADVLELVIDHISQALENSRAITYDLSPPVLYELGLKEAVLWLAERTEKEHKLKIKTELHDPGVGLSENILILLFRTIQEIVFNTIKHADASQMEIKMSNNGGKLEICVCDNGKGFNTKVLKKARSGHSGFGLFTIRERITNIGGKINISSNQKEGTEIKIYLPVSEDIKPENESQDYNSR